MHLDVVYLDYSFLHALGYISFFIHRVNKMRYVKYSIWHLLKR